MKLRFTARQRLADEVEKQTALVAAERRYLREILAGMPEGVLVADGEGRVRLVNAAYRELFDLHGELEGRPAAEISPRPWLGALIAAALDESRAQSHDLEPLPPASRNLSLRVSPLPGEGGAVVTVRDMTESSRLAEIRRDLVANVSHELKTPLTAIRGYAETLEDGALAQPEVARRFTRSIVEQCGRLEALLRDLLTLSRLESQREPPVFSAVDVSELARHAIAVLAPQARRREVDVTLETAEDLPAVAGQRDELERLLTNLIENAVKYNRVGGEVRVRLGCEGSDVVLEVRDNGIGVPEDDLDRIFERFYRVDKGRARHQGGTGLGLSIVKHVAQLHGGRVEVESRLGKGSVFRVRLPRT